MKNKNVAGTFSDILQSEKQSDYNLTQRIVNSFLDKGERISPRTVQKYIKGNLVPSYQKAKDILKIIGTNLSETELLALLEESKRQMNDLEKYGGFSKTINPGEIENMPNQTLRKRIAINAKEFTFLNDTDVPNEYSIDLIEQRVADEYGDSKYSFSRYIRDLINKDMKENENL